MSVFAREDERLIAAGDFTLKAILITESALVERAARGSAPEPTVDETPTTSAFFDLPTATATPTKTPVTSYPNSSYP